MGTTTIRFDDQTEAIVQQLKKEYSATTKAELIRLGIALLKMARDASEEGKRLGLIDRENNSVSEIALPGFTGLKNRSR